MHLPFLARSEGKTTIESNDEITSPHQFPRNSARNSQVRFKVRLLINSYVLKFPSSKRTYDVYNELRKSPVNGFVKLRFFSNLSRLEL